MMGKAGRPKLEIPRNEGVFIRLTSEEHAELKRYVKTHKSTLTTTILEGLKALQEKELREAGESTSRITTEA